jgi:hypothetical protein
MCLLLSAKLLSKIFPTEFVLDERGEYSGRKLKIQEQRSGIRYCRLLPREQSLHIPLETLRISDASGTFDMYVRSEPPIPPIFNKLFEFLPGFFSIIPR